MLLVFHSPRSGRCRVVDGYLAQALQRNRNHDTFVVRRIDVTKRPDLAEKFRVTEVPVICVVEDGRVVARVVSPKGSAPIQQMLSPWLKKAPPDSASPVVVR